ncbi:MAG: hypothetical protein LKE53_09470 [Oscillospiraceae bacterium]|nr:hypothetical protein [Oscillospiraceae bacterium]MDD3260342.1 hypothetical protein [Oscillospiraceae bacterium]
MKIKRATDNKKVTDNHMTDGMCMGVVFGTTGIIDIATGISLGILLGLAVGMSIKKGA